MSGRLRAYAFRISYGPGDDRLHEFYLPALERSVRYDRSAGFVSSTALAVAAAGVARLIQNGGRMRLLVGADLSAEDVAAIVAGHDLAERVAALYLARLADPEDALLRRRLEALAWMIAAGTLEIRVVLPAGPDGLPLPAEQAADYYHPKEGVFTDAAGDQLAFSGSINESAQAWVHNYEQFMVYRSWDETRPYLAQVVSRFDRLWQGEERDWIALPIPEAVHRRLLAFCPDEAPRVDPLEDLTRRPRAERRIAERKAPPLDRAAAQERLRFQFLRDAPYLPQARRLGAATAAVVPWPHQHRVAGAIVERFPERCLLADEVGLGKTIEAGLALRQLVLAGRVRRCLILAPKSVLRQWQEELYEKFALDVPRYDGETFWTVFGEELRPATENPFDGVALALASSQLMKRRDRQEQLLSAQPWDLVIVDEAHHARRRDYQDERFRPNRLLELLLALRERTEGLILLTATPMQVHPVEVWDLLTLLGMGGRWGADPECFLRFFKELRGDVSQADWDFVFDMVQDFFATGGTLDEAFAEVARQRIGLVEWRQVAELPHATRRREVLKRLSAAGRAVAVEFAKRHTPLRRFIFRNTRALLREYQRRGIVDAPIPQRVPRLHWIPMQPAERRLYDRIEEYITDFYNRYEARRKGLGFVMTVYRRRLTSSFYAIRQSLERRLAYLEGRADTAGLDDDDLEQDELERDVSELLFADERMVFREEIVYVEDFLHELRQLSVDSKLEWLLVQLQDLFKHRDTVVIFTQYTDTMDYLREQLRQVYGSQVACYSGRGGEEWRNGRWIPATKEEIKNAFREGERIKILLCTEAASEGLNLQTCGVLINYDMPWNPMRVEQRIGRLDRIGQTYPEVWIHNYFYEGTIEAAVYQRLSDRIDWFQTVVGDLQPILSRVAQSIQTLAMLPDAERRRRLEAELAALRAEIDQQQVATLRLDEFLETEPVAVAPDVPLTLTDLERILTQAPSLRERFRPHPEIAGAYLLSWSDSLVAVTFDRAVFDAHPETVRFLTYGERLLDALLRQVEPAATGDDGRGVLRCTAESPVPLRAYYRPSAEGYLSINRISDLEALEGAAEELSWTAEARAAAEAEFRALVEAEVQRARAAVARRRQAERLVLVERGRQVLLRAAVIELVRQQRSDMFNIETYLSKFAEAALRGLARHGYPFAPLLRLVDITGLALAQADPYFLQCLEQPDNVLQRQFEQLKQRAAELVRQLAAMPAHPAESGEPAFVETALLAVPGRVEYLGTSEDQRDGRGEQPAGR
jgi:superfamily II DNA or RNA helicase